MGADRNDDGVNGSLWDELIDYKGVDQEVDEEIAREAGKDGDEFVFKPVESFDAPYSPSSGADAIAMQDTFYNLLEARGLGVRPSTATKAGENSGESQGGQHEERQLAEKLGARAMEGYADDTSGFDTPETT
jgi:hypothetical protein